MADFDDVVKHLLAQKKAIRDAEATRQMEADRIEAERIATAKDFMHAALSTGLASITRVCKDNAIMCTLGRAEPNSTGCAQHLSVEFPSTVGIPCTGELTAHFDSAGRSFVVEASLIDARKEPHTKVAMAPLKGQAEGFRQHFELWVQEWFRRGLEYSN